MARRNRIKRELDALRTSEPGRRFQDGHERHRIRSLPLRMLVVMLGCTVMVIAAATFWLPGPNFVIVLLGLLLIAGQLGFVARLIDRGELVLRRFNEERWQPYPHKRAAIVLTWCAVVLVLTALLLGAWQLKLLPSWLPLLGRSS